MNWSKVFWALPINAPVRKGEQVSRKRGAPQLTVLSANRKCGLSARADVAAASMMPASTEISMNAIRRIVGSSPCLVLAMLRIPRSSPPSGAVPGPRAGSRGRRWPGGPAWGRGASHRRRVPGSAGSATRAPYVSLCARYRRRRGHSRSGTPVVTCFGSLPIPS